MVVLRALHLVPTVAEDRRFDACTATLDTLSIRDTVISFIPEESACGFMPAEQQRAQSATLRREGPLRRFLSIMDRIHQPTG